MVNATALYEILELGEIPLYYSSSLDAIPHGGGGKYDEGVHQEHRPPVLRKVDGQGLSEQFLPETCVNS